MPNQPLSTETGELHGVDRARPIPTQPDQPLRERLHSQPPSQRRDQHHTGVRDDALIVEFDLHAVRSDRLVILHHEGDLLMQDVAARTFSLLRRSFFFGDRTQPSDPSSGSGLSYGR